ncbi:RING finger domain protein [Pyrenophora tritici-repentis]|uniref:RING finger domain containing protein n=1 Tax=Pyrenophora tritici-repentis (strain Pt-1C-BFP) TaxID=426418 RepID=B2W7D0_PYRTR|nr:RING finger domain containing protein [Pyrenophora tritici-repentis Pt-1C-BFP]KAI0586604.1 RING finger domain protein [Pyrenophora tritici-repentis]EDU48638.1 RING finger domain containing protein [Pyrenophora tritici-repentis Pt-1C-BFP]KAI0591577.1 RING finger domain protein [Pyrenophora tritici-repentis]KAI0614831.1 RING finger domain protein [Pyrenophora tritici-repentis]KAI0627892.1 RING finger domain protein [Pyrenophora tritici-repentis]
MSSSSGHQPMPGWYWPDDVPKNEPSHATSSSTASASQPNPSSASGAGEKQSRKRTHWPPRQCRICLETVQPTFNAPSQNLPGFLQSSNVVYEDESGRLIRPCMCKGSSKYVHEACLQAWRHADPSYGRRNYWQCPTCGFKYRLARLGAGRFIGSAAAQIGLTALILISVIFVLGFVADPIINLYLDPWSFLSPWSGVSGSDYAYYYEDESSTWYEHFAKGFASMGVLGFLKVLLASPLSYFRIGGGGRGRTTGRDRYEQVSWIIILIGVGTFLAAIYKGVRVWSRRTLERAGERVMDVQGDNDDEDE